MSTFAETRSPFRRFLARLLLPLLLLAALSLPVLAESVLKRGNTGEPETLDPHKSSTVYEANIQRDLFEGLVVQAADGRLMPGVAENWEISADGTVYTFKLSEQAQWSDGSPLTATDFVYALQRLLDPATASKYASVMYPLANAEAINTGRIQDLDQLGAEAVDPHTLKLTLRAPTPYFLQLLTHHTALPLSASNVEQFGTDFTKPGNLISNGAYTLTEWIPQAHIKLVRNENFHDAANVGIDTVIYYPTEDRATALKQFRAGELHINNDAPVDQVPWMRKNLPDEFRVAPYLGIYYYPINTLREPFDDIRVRRALALAINREILVDKITRAGEVAAYSLVPPGTANYSGGPGYASFRDRPLAQRMEQAAILLKEAGFGPDNPLTLTLSYNTSENHKKVAIAIASMWKKLGVRTELSNSEVKVHYNNLQEGDFDVARAGWIADYDDPQNFLFLLQTNNPDLNYSKFSNPEFDKLMAQAAITVDLEERAGLLARAESIAMSEMPYIPVYYYVSKNLVKQSVQGWQDNVTDVHGSRFLTLAE